MSRRLRALEALAERGATAGERAAARVALEKHRPSKDAEAPAKASTVRAKHRVEFAQDDPTRQGQPRLRVDSEAAMRARFHGGQACSVVWRGKLYEIDGMAESYSGYTIDRDVYPTRYYIHLSTRRMTLVGDAADVKLESEARQPLS